MTSQLASDWLAAARTNGRVLTKWAGLRGRRGAPGVGGTLTGPLLLTESRYTGYTRRNSMFLGALRTAGLAGKNTNERPPISSSSWNALMEVDSTLIGKEEESYADRTNVRSSQHCDPSQREKRLRSDNFFFYSSYMGKPINSPVKMGDSKNLSCKAIF